MNLYKIEFMHYAPRDREYGIKGYIIAESDEEVYEWIKSQPLISDGVILYNCYSDYEEDNKEYDIFDDNYKVIGQESFKERMIRLHGEMYDEESEVCDAYYGVTHYGWTLAKEDISSEQIDILRHCGVLSN